MSEINYDTLFRIRLAIGRVGEMDLAKWWDCKETLGRTGQLSVGRGMPKTNSFARARIVFALARSRCRNVYNPAHAVTLWDLPAPIEAAFEEHWPRWIASPDSWASDFEAASRISSPDVLACLESFVAIPDTLQNDVSKMRRAAAGAAVPLGEREGVDNSLIMQLAAGFSRGEPGQLAVPFAIVRGLHD